MSTNSLNDVWPNMPPSHPKSIFEHQGLAPAPSKTYCHLSILNTKPKQQVIWREWPKIRPNQKYSHETVDPKEFRTSWLAFASILRKSLPTSVGVNSSASASTEALNDEQHEEFAMATVMKDRILVTFGEPVLIKCLEVITNASRVVGTTSK